MKKNIRSLRIEIKYMLETLSELREKIKALETHQHASSGECLYKLDSISMKTRIGRTQRI